MVDSPRPVMLITGASRGIGAAAAVQAATAGYDLCLGYRSDHESMRSVADDAEAAGARVVTVAGDIATEATVIDLFSAARDTFGRLDSVVINAGVVAPIDRVENFTVERLRSVFETNVIGAFLCAREAVRAMSTKRGGSGGTIVVVSSAASYLGSPDEFVDYAASKGATDTLTIGLAKEVANEGIRVNAVRPGLIDTDIHASAGRPDRVAALAPNIPMQRGGTADEVADVIMWLASERSTYVTGALVNASGGR
ncbi:MAG: SDR family oxidoreductase [Acidimicrobiales bacterium]